VTTGANSVFVDTNVLIYARLATSPFHATAVTRLDDLTTSGAELWVSRQTLREYLAAMSRPGTSPSPVPMATLLADVHGFLLRFQIAEDSASVTSQLESLLTVVPCGGKQVHDANIVATMLTHGITKLLTHNTADFARFSAYITVVPLVP
jgi:predicted nucleic acid-binding protein